MSGCDELLLSRYHDGELPDKADRARVEQHLLGCDRCRRELELLRDTSQLLRGGRFDDFTPGELRDLHDAIDDAADPRVWRIGGTLGLVAASVLVVGLTWLQALPARQPAARPAAPVAVAVNRPLEPWERMAITLRPDPVPQAYDEARQLALADLMLEGLNGEPKAVP
jgi:anti-sigma factor RsiW